MNDFKKKASAVACFIVFISVVNNFVYNYKKNEATVRNSTGIDNGTNWLKDWHNYEEIEAALGREGLGEVGRPANFENYRQELYDKYGFDALLSDSISVQRSIPDARTTANKTYSAKLPRSAIIIIFHNERLSVLLRTVQSILNRTPAELLHEIILVDDSSTWPDMQEILEYNLRIHLPPESSKVRLIRQTTRTGIMRARMAGARHASKEAGVLIFLDSHFEVGYNWLPPLLEPIVTDSKTCTCPIIDRIAFDTFAYTENAPWRGYFDYNLNYFMRPLRKIEREQPEKNFKNYVMMGGAMAIARDFFWQLGGFDEGMSQWGGEQFEMSFKIWMCGGQLLDVPCSRMGHLFRDTRTKGNSLLYGDYDFCNRNYKRILDVWVDERNRQYFLENRPALKNIDTGNLTERHAIRERLQCKSFDWMLQNVMPDLHDVFLPIEPAELASGQIQSLNNSNLCMALNTDNRVIMQPCLLKNNTILNTLHWQYTWRGELRTFDGSCIEPDYNLKTLYSYSCHLTSGNQRWFYDRSTQLITQPELKLCMQANDDGLPIHIAECQMKNDQMKWSFSHINQTEMDKWEKKLSS